MSVPEKGWVSVPKISCARFCSMMETPMAQIRAAMRLVLPPPQMGR